MDYTPKNRHEQYLNAMRTNDTSDLPTPITREEKYLYEIAMNSGGGGGGSDDAVKYTEQDLTAAQQAQARTNIGAASADSVPTPEQQAAWSAKQDALTFDSAPTSGSNNPVTSGGIYNALQNAGVQSNWNESDSSSKAFINNKPLIQKGNGTGGNIEGGTGITERMNSARYANSVAYGYMANADGNYTLAYGEGVMARHHYEIALGKYNVSNADTAFSIGDGPGVGADSRHNLMELKTDGRMFLNGNAVKTEGGDDNKLRLGQIYANGEFGIGAIYSDSSIDNIQFLTNEVTNDTGISSQYQFGDFVMYKKNGVYYFAPIGGRTIGISMTGQWIHAENCYCMFYVPKYSSPTSLDVSALDTSKVKTMNSMFICKDLTSLDLSTFDTSNVQDMTRMFYKCTALTTLDLSSFDMTNVTEYTDMFGDSSNPAGITTLKTPKINPHDDIPLPRTLYSQDGTAYTNLPVTTGTSIELRGSWT